MVTQHALFTNFRQYPLIPGSKKSPRHQSVGKCSVGDIIAIDVLYRFTLFASSHVLTYGTPLRSNGPVFIFIYHTLRLCAMYCVILCSFLSSLMLSSRLLLGRSFFSFPALACLTSSWWYPPLPSLSRGHSGVSGGGFWLPGNPPPPAIILFNQGVTPLLAPTFTSHLDLRLLETSPETNSGYATGSYHLSRLFFLHIDQVTLTYYIGLFLMKHIITLMI